MDPTKATQNNDGQPFDVTQRDFRENQVMNSLMENNSGNRQAMMISALVTYGFLDSPDLSKARYYNDWQLLQHDGDPNKLINGVGAHPDIVALDPVSGAPTGKTAAGEPAVGTAGPGANRDTYDNLLLIQHRTLSRGRGRDFNGDLLPECNPADPAYNPAANCDGKTNSTYDPFFGTQYVRDALGDVLLNPDGTPKIDWNQNFQYRDGSPCTGPCVDSGVGHIGGLNPDGTWNKNGLMFLVAQDVNGFFSSCLNCDSLANGTEHTFTPAHPHLALMPYTNTWRDLPSISHGASFGTLSAFASGPGRAAP